MDPTPEFVELAREARNAIADLLAKSEHDSWMQLRPGYRHLRQWLETVEKSDAAREEQEKRGRRSDEEKQAWDEYRRIQCEIWGSLSRPERMHRILNEVGDSRLTIGEIARRLTRHADRSEPASCKLPIPVRVHYPEVAPLVKKLVESGELRQVSLGDRPRNQAQYAYERPHDVSPEVAALQRAFDGEEN